MRGLRASTVFLLSCLTVSSFAQVKAVADGATVMLNGKFILTLKSGNNEARAKTVVNSLNKLNWGATLTVKPAGKGKNVSYQIWDGDRVVLTATVVEARAQKVTPEALANQWASRIRAALDVPPLKVPTDPVKMGVGHTKRIPIEGYLAAKAKVTSDNSGLYTLSRDKNDLVITAKALGSSVITVQVGDISKQLKISVLPSAIELPQSFTVSVTGNPCDAETVKGAIETAMWTRLKLAPDAQYRFSVPKTNSLNSGETVTAKVEVAATAPDTLPTTGTVTVTVVNEGIAQRQDTSLWYCNDPENVKAAQNLFAAYLVQDHPVRMLYHHMNASVVPLFIEVNLVNESNMPARVLILPGDSTPHLDPVKAGLQAGDIFIRNWVSYSGDIVEIPPRSSVPVTIRRLAPQETMSGLCHLRLLSGPSQILVRTDSKTPYQLDGRLTAALNSPTAWRRLPYRPLDYTGQANLIVSKHIYPQPFKKEGVHYTLGGRYGFVRIGQRPIPGEDGRHLDGNFGVVYNIEAKLENPTGTATDIEVVFEASAGYSGAIFVVNGEVRRMPLIHSKGEVQVTKVRLNAGETKTLNLMTIPLSGSSYPATIVIRPANTALKL
jgi:hypothetical protein